MKPKIFIDGSEGTTGLKIFERLSGRKDIDLLVIDADKRKDVRERRRLLNAADLVFLCLPDDAARKTVPMIDNPDTRVIDPSSAHRVADGWVYGLPEMSHLQKVNINKAKRVSNPGCHATGVILLLRPLFEKGLIPAEYPITITSLTGYTGGGKSMIEDYENTDRTFEPGLNAPRLYGTAARHKHLPEIMKYSGLRTQPAFLPIVDDYPQGMQVIVPLILPEIRQDVYKVLSENYSRSKNIEVSDAGPLLAPSNVNAGSDRVTIRVQGFDDTIILTAQFDNLGKGASGAAVQNMNIMLGFDEYQSLEI